MPVDENLAKQDRIPAHRGIICLSSTVQQNKWIGPGVGTWFVLSPDPDVDAGVSINAGLLSCTADRAITITINRHAIIQCTEKRETLTPSASIDSEKKCFPYARQTTENWRQLTSRPKENRFGKTTKENRWRKHEGERKAATEEPHLN